MVALTIWTHLQQFEDLKFLNFSGKACPRPPKNPSRVPNRTELGENVPILLENSESGLDLSQDTSIPILKNSCHKPTSKEIYFLWNYYSICQQINKPLNLDIQVNSELQSWLMTLELQNKLHNNAGLFDHQHFQIKHFAANSLILLHHYPVRH